jgi:hypothetical protein
LAFLRYVFYKEINMEITKEKIDEAIQHFLKMDSGNRTFTEAYKKGEPYYFKRHKSLIVPSEMINNYFGCSKYRMSTEIVEILQKFGARRAYRQIYENGKQGSAILVWVFEV